MDKRYIEIPGNKTHELPPLLIHSFTGTESTEPEEEQLTQVMGEAEEMMVASDDSPKIQELRRFELALNLAKQYKRLTFHWLWGDSVLEWIRQCETTFESEASLRDLLYPDVW